MVQQLPFSILFAWAFFVVKFYRTIYSFTFSAAFGRFLFLSLFPTIYLWSSFVFIIHKFCARSHVMWITVGFCHGNYYPQKYEKSHLFNVPVCVCVCGFFWCDSIATVPCVGLSQFWHRFAFCMVSLCPFFSFFSIFPSVVVDAATKFHSLCFMICYFAATIFSFSLHCNALHTLCTLCYATKAATSNENRRKTDHKKWAKLNYSRI